MIRKKTVGQPAKKAISRVNTMGGTSASRRTGPRADWRGDVLRRVRKLIKAAVPGITEEVKWRKPSNPAGVPVWSHGGIICTGETYKHAVKLTFAKGASLKDPAGLFNAGFDGRVRRAIDIHEGDDIDESAFQDLIRAAVFLNLSGNAKTAPTKPKRAVAKGGRPTATKPTAGPSAPKPALLAGGNPQIAMGDGDAPVQAYIAAMPGWKRDVGRRLDSLIVRTVPRVRKAVKWNSPFYGIEGQGWFLNLHCFTNYIKVAFFRGASLRPAPPGESKHKDVRYLDIFKDDALDEPQLVAWVRQASQLPGWGKS